MATIDASALNGPLPDQPITPLSSSLAKPAKQKIETHFETLKVPRASELVAEKLRALIVEGAVPEGAGLPPEKELVVQLGVSRATLREALRMLETEGLIATRPGAKGGIIVKKPGVASLTRSLALLLQIDDTPLSTMLEARRLLEPLCANLAADRATPEDLQELAAAISTMRQNLDDITLYLEGQLRFHTSIMAAGHNVVLGMCAISIGELISRQTEKLGLSRAQRNIGLNAAESILAAIQEKNGRLAARRVEAHLIVFDQLLLRQ